MQTILDAKHLSGEKQLDRMPVGTSSDVLFTAGGARGCGIAVYQIKSELLLQTVIVEDPRIQEFVLELLPRTLPTRLQKVSIGKLPLWILVQVLHVRVRGCAVNVEVILLQVLAVIALAVGEPEQALLQNRVPFVPKRQGKAQGSAYRRR